MSPAQVFISWLTHTFKAKKDYSGNLRVEVGHSLFCAELGAEGPQVGSCLGQDPEKGMAFGLSVLCGERQPWE